MPHKERKTQGKLIYLMGASGAGKDTLLKAVRPLMDEEQEATKRPLIIMQRHITRPASNNADDEQHKACTEEDFLHALAAGEYTMHWQSHGLHYGISKSIYSHLQQGALVLVNGSREYLPQAQQTFPELIPLLVQVKAEALRARLMARGRESQEDIERRVQRATQYNPSHDKMIVIDNSQALDSTLHYFKALIEDLRQI